MKRRFFNLFIVVFCVVLCIIFFGNRNSLNLFAFDSKALKDNYVHSDIYQDDLLKTLEYQDTGRRLYREWKWKSFNGNKYQMKFYVLEKHLQNATRNRKNTSAGPECWREMYNYDKQFLRSMLDQYRNIIQVNRLTKREAMEMVVSSTQHLAYTYVKPGYDECKQARDVSVKICKTGGCCDGVMPWGVYSPVEYAAFGTGDCDTKSLFALTVLKELNMNFDVAMLTGMVDNDYHAILGVFSLNPTFRDVFVRDIRTGKKYFGWEMTSEGCYLGQKCFNHYSQWEIYKM